MFSVYFKVKTLCEELLDALQGFLHLVVLGTQADAHITLAVASEDKAWCNEHPCLVEHFLGQVFHISIALRDFTP